MACGARPFSSNRRPMAGACLSPRLASARSWSDWPGPWGLALAWRINNKVFILAEASYQRLEPRDERTYQARPTMPSMSPPEEAA